MHTKNPKPTILESNSGCQNNLNAANCIAYGPLAHSLGHVLCVRLMASLAQPDLSAKREGLVMITDAVVPLECNHFKASVILTPDST